MPTLPELAGPVSPTADPDAFTITGNHYVCFPRIARADGALHGINVLHRGLNGLVEWSGERDPAASGEPLLRIAVTPHGDRPVPDGPEWEHVDGWIPRWRRRHGPLRVLATVCAPGGVDPLIRGGLIYLELVNDGVAEQTCDVTLDGRWAWTLLSMMTPRPLRGENRLLRAPGLDAVVLEAGEGGTTAALAICESTRGDGVRQGAVSPEAAVAGADWIALAPGAEIAAPNGTLLAFRLARRIALPPRRRAAVAYYIGVAPERDGAVATAAALRRTGAEELIHLGRLDLARLGRRAGEASVRELLNRNLYFNYYCAVGRALDDDLIYPLLSRSAVHGATAVVSDRAALLWSLPAVTLADGALARELLIRAFEQYSARAGEQWKYLDGAVLAPGLQLDQICAYALALDRYVQTTEDDSVLDEPLVQDVLRELDDLLYGLLHREVLLCATELLPSGHAPDHDYSSYGNVLVWSFARTLRRVWRALPDEPRARLAGADEEIAAAVWHRCTADVDGVPVLGYTSDLAGQVAIYDDPDGSLALLPFLGFCGEDDPIWSNTLDLLRSEANPLWRGNAAFAGLADRGDPRAPRFAALCAELLGPRADEALRILRGLRLPDGLAVEAYDADTGTVAHGAFAPALAGFLAWALEHALRRSAEAAVASGGRL